MPIVGVVIIDRGKSLRNHYENNLPINKTVRINMLICNEFVGIQFKQCICTMYRKLYTKATTFYDMQYF